MYQELAGIYDRVYGFKDYKSESARLVDIVENHDPKAKSLLDVACGTGGHLEHLQHRYECEGLDLNEEMLELARVKLPAMKFHSADVTEFELEKRYDAVVCLFSAVGHLKTVERLDTAISRMAAHLAPNGILVIEPWIDPADWIVGHVGMDTFEDEDMKVARLSVAEPVERGRVVMEFLIGTKAGVTRLRDEHEMGWFTRTEYEKSFEDAGLTVRFEKPGISGRGIYIGTGEK